MAATKNRILSTDPEYSWSRSQVSSNHCKISKMEYSFASKCRLFYELLVLFYETEVLVVYSTCTTYTLLQCGAWWWHTAKPPPHNTTLRPTQTNPPTPVLPTPITQWPDAMSQRPPRRTWAGKYPFVRRRYPRDSSPGTVVHTTTHSQFRLIQMKRVKLIELHR